MAASAQRKRLLSAVVGTDQDFEFYPTTDQIIAAINHDMASSFKRGNTLPRISENGPSLLDIGAGDGETLLKLKASKRYAIEKSIPLLDAMPPNISVIGTNFDEQQLIDKEVDVIRANGSTYRTRESTNLLTTHGWTPSEIRVMQMNKH